MPNWVRNELSIVTFDDNKRKEVLEFIKGEEDTPLDIDFNKIIPMPEELHDNGGWYDWRIYNWGTKWNSSPISCDDYLIVFETAWSTPEPVIKKLSELFKDIEFFVRYADEDFGNNLGEYTYKNGYLVQSYYPESVESAMAMAEEIWGYNPYDEE